MRTTFHHPSVREKRHIYFNGVDAGFGTTVDDNSINRDNNEGVFDHGVGVAARISRHTVDFGNNMVSLVSGHQRRHAYAGAFGATRARAVDVALTPIEMVTSGKPIRRFVTGAMGLFDVAGNALVVDPLTMIAGDHTNTPSREHTVLDQFSKQELDAAANN